MKIIFFGTPDFAKKQLLYLLDHNIDIIAVVTQPDKPKGRKQKLLPCPVKEAYLERSLSVPMFQPVKASDPEFIQKIKDLKPDLLIVVAYGQILKQSLLDVPVYDCINVHASLLPKYRGAAPIQRAIMSGERETGITIMKMVLRLDAGDMLLTHKIPISNDATFDQIEENLSNISGPALIEVIDQYEKNTINPVVQNESEVTYANKITPDDLFLDFNEDAKSLHNKVRAFSSKPGAYCFVQINDQLKRIKILKTQVEEILGNSYQNMEYSNKKWIVGCKNKSLNILRLQLEGKKVMDFIDFVKGNPREIFIKNS